MYPGLASWAKFSRPSGTLWRLLRHRLLRAPGSELNGDGFHFCVFVQSVLAEFAAHPRLLEAAEGCPGIENVVAVDPDRTSPYSIRYRVRLLDVVGPDARC